MGDDDNKKECKECGRALPLDDFYRHPQMSDGRLSFCKECIKRRTRDRRDQNLDEHRARDREYWHRSKKRRKQTALSSKKWRERNPEKARAHNVFHRAMKAGKIQRGACQVCGTTKNIEGHHHDYSKPLDVVWLCRHHHGRAHSHRRRT